jgi:hypothetical protein
MAHHQHTSFLRSPHELEQLLAFMSDAVRYHAGGSGSTALQTALLCLPHEVLAELVAIAECGRHCIGRTIGDVEDLVRFGIGGEPKEHLVRKLLEPEAPEFIAIGLRRLADLPRRPANAGDDSASVRRNRRTRPIEPDEELSDGE